MALTAFVGVLWLLYTESASWDMEDLLLAFGAVLAAVVMVKDALDLQRVTAVVLGGTSLTRIVEGVATEFAREHLLSIAGIGRDRSRQSSFVVTVGRSDVPGREVLMSGLAEDEAMWLSSEVTRWLSN